VKPVANKAVSGHQRLQIVKEMNPEQYCVESVDGISPASKSGQVIYRYAENDIPAAVAHQGSGYRCVSFGFPIEAIESEENINNLISTTLEYLKK
jgi:hypothetical protein